jgi:hypothetical protein
VPWSTLEHAYGTAEDVPNLLGKLLQSDEKVREDAWYHLYGNVFHQGTRYPATPYVIPFLIEMCASPEILKRGDILSFWGSLITGYFSIQERPCWGDGDKIHWYGQVQVVDNDDPYARALHQIYLESLRGYKLLCKLLVDEEKEVRMGAAWMFACLPTLAETSVTILLNQLKAEASGWVRAAIAFALGELGVSPPLHQILNEDTFSAARCMAACELVRIEPSAALIEPLLHFVAEPIEGYERIPGAGGKSTGDAAFSISYLPEKIQQKAIPAICDRLDQSRAFDTMPLVNTLLSGACTIFCVRREGNVIC